MKRQSRQLNGAPWAALILGHSFYTRLALLVVAALFSAAIFSLFRAPLESFAEQGGAVAWRLDPDTRPEERINIIAIDERSIRELGAWPWSRTTMARLSEALGDYGVQLQLYDIAFPEARPGDEAFVAALSASPSILSQVPVLEGGQQVRTGLLGGAVSGVSCSANGLFPAADGYVANAAVFASVAKGHISPRVDADGGVRKEPALVCVDGQAYPALALTALMMAGGGGQAQGQVSLNTDTSLFEPPALLTLSAYPGFAIPLDSAGNLRVSFSRAPESYRAFSAVDVIEGRIEPELLANTWALVGYTAFGLVDIVPTPFRGAAPGVEIQARILGSFLDADIPYTPRSSTLLLFGVGLLFALGLLFVSSRQEKTAIIGLSAGALLLPAASLLLHVQLLSSANIWLGWLSPALFAVLASALLVLHELVRVRLERGRVLGNLTSYLPADLAREIAYSLPESSISARRQSVTLLSADLRNFSAFSEARPPEESAALLHFFFMRATDIVEKHKGQVYEFKGDGLLALWEDAEPDAVRHALDAAQEMQASIQELLPQAPAEGLEPLALGIGIEQGPVLIGSIGSSHRRTPTLLGETVTIALRIQDMTAELAQPVLIGECAARRLPGTKLQSQGSYLLNGLQKPHVLFAPELPGDSGDTARDEPRLRVLKGGRG